MTSFVNFLSITPFRWFPLVCPLFALSLWTVSPSIGWSYLLSDLAQASPLGGTSVCRKSPLSPSRLQKLRFPPGFWGNISGFRHFLAIFYRKSINIRFPIDKSSPFRYNIYRCRSSAGVAQLVEQLICNQQVGGSNPSTSSTISPARTKYGGVPEWSKGADCKSVASASMVRIHSPPPWRGRQGTPYSPPSKEGGLPLHKILAAAWSCGQPVHQTRKTSLRTGLSCLVDRRGGVIRSLRSLYANRGALRAPLFTLFPPLRQKRLLLAGLAKHPEFYINSGGSRRHTLPRPDFCPALFLCAESWRLPGVIGSQSTKQESQSKDWLSSKRS